MPRVTLGENGQCIDLCIRLSALGVTKIVADFEGSGDDGGIEETDYLDSNDLLVDAKEVVTAEDIELVTEMLYTFIQKSEANFNDDGCRGSITVNVIERKIEMSLESYYTDSRHSDEEWLL